jgi:hypothetical protein
MNLVFPNPKKIILATFINSKIIQVGRKISFMRWEGIEGQP